MKKLAILVALFAVVALTGAFAEGKQESVTVSVGMPSNWKDWGGITDLMNAWAAESSNKVDIQLGEDTQFIQMLMAKLTTKEAWDVVFVGTGLAALKYNPAANFADMSGAPWAGNLTDLAKTSLTYGGKLRGAPFSGSSAMGIVYNKKVFAAAGITVPKTIDQLNEAARVLKAKGITPFYMAVADGWTVSQTINAAWADIYASDKTILEKLNSNKIRWEQIPALMTYLKMWEQQAKAGYFNADMATATYAMSIKEVAEGRAAMTYQGTWMATEIAKVAGADCGMFAVPTASGDAQISQAGSYAVYAYEFSKNKKQAMDLVNWLCKAENLQKFYDTKPDISVWKNVSAATLDPLSRDAYQYVKAGKSQSHWNDVYVVPWTPDVSTILSQVFLGVKDAAGVAKDLSDYFQKSGKQLEFAGF
jgi:raffinose/stachyose/melibiose transport system substrate-binding protein